MFRKKKHKPHAELEKHLSGEAHDRSFDAEAVRIDTDTSAVRLPLFEFGGSLDEPVATLIVRGATQVEIQDTEQIQYYPINYIELHAEPGCIIIEGVIPITVRMWTETPEATTIEPYKP